MKKLIIVVLAMCSLVSCGEKKEETTLSGLKKSDFVSEVQGKPTLLYVLKNKNGAEACVTNYGSRLVSVMVPDKNGEMVDVVLGHGSIAGYMGVKNNYGAVIGRYGNRIKMGQFTLDSVAYQLPANNNGHCLHGGPEGFDTRVWTGNQVDGQTIELTYLSKDGEAGFPGNLNITVTYKLTDDNAVDIKYEAQTDKPTVVNLTNHSYFNLSGVPGSQNLGHQVMIDADRYVSVDSTSIPLGETPSVEGTPMDLRTLTVVGEHIDDDFDQLKIGKGFDHTWVLNAAGDVTKVAARVISPESGIVMDVYTNEPGLQFYAGNAMRGTDIGKGGITYPVRGAVCLESQHYPDSPNQPQFPSTVLRPGEKYLSQCIYKFSVQK